VTESITTFQIAGMVLTIAVPFAGALYGVFKYSVGRNILAMDQKFDSLQVQVSNIGTKVDDLKDSYGKEAMTRNECSLCRRECTDRVVAYQRDILEWMRRQDDKSDALLMMIANLNNGAHGGVKNGLKG